MTYRVSLPLDSQRDKNGKLDWRVEFMNDQPAAEGEKQPPHRIIHVQMAGSLSAAEANRIAQLFLKVLNDGDE